MFHFENTYAQLPDIFFSPAQPAKFPKPELIVWNEELARHLGAETTKYTQNDLVRFFSGQHILPGSRPIALAYAGHQFGHFVPQLGDGRALLLGEIIDSQGKRHDLQLKGSGRTVFSRNGDGRAPLGPVLREYLVSEGMHHLGLPTTRALAAVATGENVLRQKEYPGAVLARVASSHIRVGTFEYVKTHGTDRDVKTLADYSIDRHYPEISSEQNVYLSFLDRVFQNQVELITGWIAFGFIHGVMNTDNMSIAGETIDYGPCAFMDHFRFDQVYSFIDRYGRYSYANQAQIMLWNLSQLGECLLPLIHPEKHTGKQMVEGLLNQTAKRFKQRFTDRMRKKLGLFNALPQDKELIQKWLTYLESAGQDFTLGFHSLAKMLDEGNPTALFPPSAAFDDFYQQWRDRLQEQDASPSAVQDQMLSVNPRIIPRNHQLEKVINAAEQGDYGPFHELHHALQTPYGQKESIYQHPPRAEERVQTTFCGT